MITYSRREFVELFILASATALPSAAQAVAEKLSPTDPKAAALNYVEDAKQVDARRFPNFKAGQSCANCKLVQLRYGFLRPCELFPGKVVSEKGWCSAWVEKKFR